jgi:hypothetical protein
MRKLLLVLCLSMLVAPATARSPCDRLCSAVAKALDAQASGFEELKGAPVTGVDNVWKAKVKVPGWVCSVANAPVAPQMSFGCVAQGSKRRADKEISQALAALRSGAPAWHWYREKGTNLPCYGGPGEAAWFAMVSMTPPPPDAEVYKTTDLVTLTIFSAAQKPNGPLEPYRPPH